MKKLIASILFLFFLAPLAEAKPKIFEYAEYLQDISTGTYTYGLSLPNHKGADGIGNDMGEAQNEYLKALGVSTTSAGPPEEATIDKLGKEGWELVNCTGEQSRKCYFKRER